MALVEQLKRPVAKLSLERSLNNQILDYKAIPDLCKNDMMSIKFLGICEESKSEKWYESGDTAPVTWSTHDLVPFSSSRNGPKLTSEDE